MRFPIQSPGTLFRRKSFKDDAIAGLVLGVESVPDGLASGLLAGVSPLAGLYGYLFGMVGGALFTSSTYMAVQATGAMSIIVADSGLSSTDDPARSLYTLSILTGVVMIVAGALRMGRFLRFVSNSVMTGFISAVGVNIVLGQLSNFFGYDASGSGRLDKTWNLLTHLTKIDLPTTMVGLVTLALILVLQRTRVGPLSLLVAVVVGSGLASLLNARGSTVSLVRDVADIPSSLPLPVLPIWGEMPNLLIPAISLAFVGLVQGAGVSAGLPNPDGHRSDPSQDFIGQGVGNITAGLFHGMPVGGSMSASSLAATAGARSRAALFYAGVVMALVVVLLSPAVSLVAMPSLAALLVVVGAGTVKPRALKSVGRTGRAPRTVMIFTFLLTLTIPLQYAVLIGVGTAAVLFVIGQSQRLETRRIRFRPDGSATEEQCPGDLADHDVMALQMYGPVFFANAQQLENQWPRVTSTSTRSVVILRMRGADSAGATFLDVLDRYNGQLRDVGSRLVIVTDNAALADQLRRTVWFSKLGEENVYMSTPVLGETLRRAVDEATQWVGQ